MMTAFFFYFFVFITLQQTEAKVRKTITRGAGKTISSNTQCSIIFLPSMKSNPSKKPASSGLTLKMYIVRSPETMAFQPTQHYKTGLFKVTAVRISSPHSLLFQPVFETVCDTEAPANLTQTPPYFEEVGGSAVIYRWARGSARRRETSGVDVVMPILFSNVVKHHHFSACRERRTHASSSLVPHH
jgi:hypothetical protein